MIEYRLSVETLGTASFGYCPLAEVASSLRQLAAPRPDFVLERWVKDVRPHLAQVDTALLTAVAPPGKWVADFFAQWSSDPNVTIEQQLDWLGGLPVDRIRSDLEAIWRGRSLPRVLAHVLTSDRPGDLIADAIWQYWQVAIHPYWPRLRAVLEDDVAYRSARIRTHGVLAVFEDLHPEVTVLNGVIRVDKPHHADVRTGGTPITLVPSVFIWPDLMLGPCDQPLLMTYAARGIGRVWEGLREVDAAKDLGSLLGRNRARILRKLEIPMSTTQLARDLAQSPGTVHDHLTVLKRNGLLESWRSGRSVFYRRTALATAFLSTADDPTVPHPSPLADVSDQRGA